MSRALFQAIADEILSLADRKDSPAGRMESAGRFLMKAVDAGALASPDWIGFVTLVRQRAEQTGSTNPWISAWSEAVWWIRGKPDVQDLEGGFAEDCRLVADAILGQQTTPLPEAHGVAPRNAKFLEWYEACGTDTYHKPAKIQSKWWALTDKQRAAICPDSPAKVTRQVVVTGIKRARTLRGGELVATKRRPRKA